MACYDRMGACPQGLLVTVDAICVFNPTYGATADTLQAGTSGHPEPVGNARTTTRAYFSAAPRADAVLGCPQDRGGRRSRPFAARAAFGHGRVAGVHMGPMGLVGAVRFSTRRESGAITDHDERRPGGAS
jgi:hypothetical protein